MNITPKAAERFKDTYKGSGLLLPAIQRHVMREAVSRPSGRADDVMHPSEMCKRDWCSRHDYYRITGVTPQDAKESNPSFQLENVFNEGHHIHRKYQNWLTEMGLLEGMWACRNAECAHYWWDTSPECCPVCFQLQPRYREIPFDSPDLMIKGHADGAVSTGGDWLDVEEPFLLEIKSVGVGTLMFEAPMLHQRYVDGASLDNIWRDIKTPFPTHIKQATLYWWLSGQKYKKILFIYECKWNQQVKELVVVPNVSWIQDLLEGAKEVVQGTRAGIAPYRPLWADPAVKKCAACPYANTCWEHTDETKSTAAAPITVARSSSVRRKRAFK